MPASTAKASAAHNMVPEACAAHFPNFCQRRTSPDISVNTFFNKISVVSTLCLHRFDS